jgi:hypothetical protein
MYKIRKLDFTEIAARHPQILASIFQVNYIAHLVSARISVSLSSSVQVAGPQEKKMCKIYTFSEHKLCTVHFAITQTD